jgi:hypothetical protein
LTKAEEAKKAQDSASKLLKLTVCPAIYFLWKKRELIRQ